jgi:hypothetical protein
MTTSVDNATPECVSTSMTLGELIELLAERPVLDDAPRDQLRELVAATAIFG